MAPNEATSGARRLTAGLASAAFAGFILCNLAWLVLGLLRPGYSMVSRPVSALGVGPHGVWMDAAFVLTGSSLAASVAGLSRAISGHLRPLAHAACTALLLVSPIGFVWTGLVTMDSLTLHTLGAQLAIGAPLVTLPLAGLLLRPAQGWRRLGNGLLLAGPLTLALLVGFIESVPRAQLLSGVGGGRFGLWQRALGVEVLAWYLALAWATMRRQRVPKPYKGPAMEGFIASWYARNTRGDVREYRACAEALAKQLPAGGRVLEVAPGPGYLAIELARLGDYRVTGLDISRTFVQIAQENARAAGAAVDFRHGNASQMPFADATFDLVACRAAFKNFSDPLGALNEVHRVLKPGGRASILDLRKEATREEIAPYVDEMKLSPVSALFTKLTFRFFLTKNAYTREAIERLAAQSRFGACEVVSRGIEFDLRLAKPAASA